MKFAIFSALFLCLALVPFSSYAARVNLNVPFTSQAPFGNWAQPWQDFCEEASMVMAAHWVWGFSLTPKIADLEMSIIKTLEGILLKHDRDTTAAESAEVFRMLYGFKHVSTRTIGSADEIKKELDQGNLVIIPAAGRLLGNPYFVLPGPLYHMVVVRGYDDAKGIFITNDPGTRRGEGLTYLQEKLFNAIHDWNGGDVMSGEKNIIIVGK